MTTGYIYKKTILGTYYTGAQWFREEARSWSGTDSAGVPPRPKEYETITIPGRFSLKGKWLPELVYKRRKWGDTVKRARTLGEHNYSTNRYEMKGALLTFNRVWTGYVHVLGGCPITAASPWSSNDDLALVGKLRERVLGSGFNAGVALAEAPKAIAMITDSASRIYFAYRSLRKGDVHRAWSGLVAGTERKALKLPPKTKASNFWLQSQYGWLPLLKDTEDCAKFLAHQTSSPQVNVVTAVRHAAGKNFHDSKVLSYNLSGGCRVYMRRRMEHSKRVRAILSEVNVPQLVGLTDTAAIAWEITPYSFVADWFIPVGNYLDALRTARSISATYVTTERKRELFSELSLDFDPPQSNITVWNPKPYDHSHEKFWFSRTVSNSLSIPLPEVKPWAKIASVGHAINAVALLVSRFGSRSG